MDRFLSNCKTLSFVKLFVKLFPLAAVMAAGLVVVQSALAQSNGYAAKHFVEPTVFQAAGLSAASIQSTVDQFRAALGAVNNANTAGPLTSGRREINWDGGSPTNAATTLTGTPLTAFLNTRGANITTRVQPAASLLADREQRHRGGVLCSGQQRQYPSDFHWIRSGLY